MMETKDFISMIVGVIIGAAGVLPLLGKAGVGPAWFDLYGQVPTLLSIAIYIVAAAGFYLAIESIIEITNSNAIGWWSFFIAVALFTLGIVQILGSKGILPFQLPSFIQFTPLVYSVIFIVEGLFLVIAGFAMEL
ncbi:hypothetical protein ACFL0W_04740 [Nanoarchaeota archaeon]